MLYPRELTVQIGDTTYELEVGLTFEAVHDILRRCLVDSKRRQPFEVCDDSGELLAMGLLYDDGNVQVLWRQSVGWTAEQFHSIANMFGIESGATTVRLLDSLPIPPAE